MNQSVHAAFGSNGASAAAPGVRRFGLAVWFLLLSLLYVGDSILLSRSST
jgi:hypothetical protein